ncbi:MAG TPA: ATP-binding protein, partial [Fibrobacteria bacterium]|nr:ATP-binding protein [Fibrobacteria bacterium]
DTCRSMLDRSLAARERHPDQPGFRPSTEEIAGLFRDLHTIKGNSATYGFERLGRLAHQGEDILEDLKEPITVRTAVTLRALLEKFDEMDKAYQEILATEKKLSGGGADGDMLVQVSERKLEHVRKMAHTLHLPAQASSHPFIDPEAVQILTEACEHLRDVPLIRLADKYRSMIERLGNRMEKQIRFEVVPAHLEVGPTFFAPVDEALVHILRNSVDHGLESPADRVAAGKNETGIIRMSVAIEEDCVKIQVADDGHGIDTDRVVEKAVAEGIISKDDAEQMGRDQRLLLIFESGISTATSITDVSGRGVGMAAVRESIESMGGNIRLASEPGKGTETTLTIPLRDL